MLEEIRGNIWGFAPNIRPLFLPESHVQDSQVSLSTPSLFHTSEILYTATRQSLIGPQRRIRPESIAIKNGCFGKFWLFSWVLAQLCADVAKFNGGDFRGQHPLVAACLMEIWLVLIGQEPRLLAP